MISIRLSLWAAGICAATMVAGCAQSQPAPVTPTAGSFSVRATPIPPYGATISTAGWLSPQSSNGPVIYLADEGNSKILVYPESGGSLLGEITKDVSTPYGLYVDKKGNLYVANAGNDTVTEYPAGATSPSATWSQDLKTPLYPIVDKNGDLFVSNQHGGAVVEYRAGSTAAYQVLQTPGVETDGMDFDSQGNLYVAYRKNDSNRRGAIEEFPPGSTQGHVLPMKLTAPQGLIVDSSGNLLVVATEDADRIELFQPGRKYRSESVRAPTGATLTQLAIEQNESQVFVSSLDGSVFTIVYPFPSSGKLSPVVQTQYEIQGVALSNGQSF